MDGRHDEEELCHFQIWKLQYELPTGGSKYQVIYQKGWRGWRDAGTLEWILSERRSIASAGLEVFFGSCWWLNHKAAVCVSMQRASSRSIVCDLELTMVTETLKVLLR